MTTTLRFLLGALLFSTAACAADRPSDEVASSNEQGISAAESPGVDMYIAYTARQELADALGTTPEGEFDYSDVVVPGVLRIQHQYSVAALRLEPASWGLVTGLPESDAAWGVGGGLGVAFPRRPFGEDAASEAAARKLFEVMVKATVTTEQIARDVVATTRKTAKGNFWCTKTEGRGRTSFDCTIANVAQVGSPGLLWGALTERAPTE